MGFMASTIRILHSRQRQRSIAEWYMCWRRLWTDGGFLYGTIARSGLAYEAHDTIDECKVALLDGACDCWIDGLTPGSFDAQKLALNAHGTIDKLYMCWRGRWADRGSPWMKAK